MTFVSWEVIIIVVAVILELYLSPHWCQTVENGQLMEAWYIFLPGKDTGFYPEIKMEMESWSGTRRKGRKAKAPTNDPGYVAAVSLQSLGLFTDCEPTQIDGKWYLYRPSRTETYFSWRTHVRISKLVPVN